MQSTALRILHRGVRLASCSSLRLLHTGSSIPLLVRNASPALRSRSHLQRLTLSTTRTEPQHENLEDDDSTASQHPTGSKKIDQPRAIPKYSPAEIQADPKLFESITGGDEALEKKLQLIFVELEVMLTEGREVPESTTIEHWKDMLQLDSYSKRIKFYHFLFIKNIKHSMNKEKRRLKVQKRREESPPEFESEEGHIQYGLHRNTIFLRIYEPTMMQALNHKLIRAMELGEQKLIIDCGFEKEMTMQEVNNFSKQLVLAFRDNRRHHSPLDLYMCNARKEDKTFVNVKKMIPIMDEPDFPFNLTEKSYLDIAPKENIVYLTPHCREVLKTYDHDATYIIGGIVDRSNQTPLTLAKAKREGLRMAKLPLDHYLNWGSSAGKSLTIDQMINIMLDMRATGDWKYALRHIPRRKLMSDEEVRAQAVASRGKGGFFQNKRTDRDMFKRRF